LSRVAPLALGVLVSVAVGAYGVVHSPTGRAFFRAPFPPTYVVKIWLTIAVVAVTLVHLFSARWPAAHRVTGWAAFVLSLPVAVHCLWALGFRWYSGRVLAHSLFGCAVYGAFAAKVLGVRLGSVPGRVVPLWDGVLFVMVLGAGLTSAVWYLVSYGLPG
jgi:uncharacterized protein DUF6529